MQLLQATSMPAQEMLHACYQVCRELAGRYSPMETTPLVLLPKSPVQATTVLCRQAGFQPAMNSTRGFDHGTFVPVKLAFPDAAVPVVQLSLLSSLDARVCTTIPNCLCLDGRLHIRPSKACVFTPSHGLQLGC